MNKRVRAPGGAYIWSKIVCWTTDSNRKLDLL